MSITAHPHASAGAPTAAGALGTVPREGLVARLVGSVGVPLVVVCAPAGYGKTTLLGQWARRDPRPFVWLALGRAHRDPAVLAAEVGLALAAAPADAPYVLVVDGADALEIPAAAAVIAGAVATLPPGGQVAVGCRIQPALPLGRLLAERRVLRVGAEELALDDAGAGALLRGEGLDLPADEVAALVRRAEGWPAGLSLAALALRERGGSALGDLGGDDRVVAEYLRDELLGPTPPETVDFLVRTSVLDRLSGPLCDAVLGRSGSGVVLRDLHRARMLVVPLDRTEEWYRYHGLLADLLRGELRRREPGLVRELHGRASRWYEREGDREAAVRHARAAGDLSRAAGLVWDGVPGCYGRGRVEVLERWLTGFDADQLASSSRLALTAAWCALERDGAAVEAWTAAAEHSPGAGPELRPALALLRAAVARDGIEAMRRDAALAYRLEPDESPWRAFACLLEGVGHDLAGDPGRARRCLQEGANRAGALIPAVAAPCLARLALLALGDGDWDRATRLALRARAQAERAGLREYATMALVYPVSGLILARSGRAREARADLAHGGDLVDRMAEVAPWLAVEARITLARAALLLGDLAGGRRLVAEAGRRLRCDEALSGLRPRLEAARDTTAMDPAGSPAGAGSLTTAEMRVLRYLPTHLSFREIAGQLYVSRFTVKSQALAVYRKLGATSRAEAVERARGLGLLGQ